MLSLGPRGLKHVICHYFCFRNSIKVPITNVVKYGICKVRLLPLNHYFENEIPGTFSLTDLKVHGKQKNLTFDVS